VVEVDERWSTTEAQSQAAVEPAGRAGGVDALAAAVILDQYLHSGVADAAA
jgi:RNase H-fold protein (predicted Holliday junction resolvase)